MQIRKATVHDIDTLVSLRIDFIHEMHPMLTHEQVKTHANVLIDYFKRHIGHDFFGYFAEVGDVIASVVFLVLLERPANPRLPTGKIGMILNVHTKQQFRKQGFASALLKEAISDAKALGASVIELQASDMGKHVYQQLGFEVQTSEYTPMVYRVNTQSDDPAENS